MRVDIVLRSAEIYPVFFDVSCSKFVVGLSNIMTWADIQWVLYYWMLVYARCTALEDASIARSAAFPATFPAAYPAA